LTSITEHILSGMFAV